MPELEIAIGSIKYKLSCKKEEEEAINGIAKTINQKINKLSLETGRMNEKILLLTLLLINTGKIKKIKNKNFDETLLKILKSLSSLLYTKTNEELEEKLIIANIIKESELENISEELPEEDITIKAPNDFNEEKHYKEMADLVDDIAGYLTTISEKLKP